MSPKKQGLFQALAVLVYITAIGLLMGNGEAVFGDIDLPFGPVLLLLLFSTSALVCVTLVLYKPYKLFIAGDKKAALDTVISTAAWLFGFLAVFILGVVIFK